MGYITLHPTVTLAEGRLDDGSNETAIWRSEVDINGTLVDATPWCSSPARATARGRDLHQQWSTFKRWIPDHEVLNAVFNQPKDMS